MTESRTPHLDFLTCGIAHAITNLLITFFNTDGSNISGCQSLKGTKVSVRYELDMIKIL